MDKDYIYCAQCGTKNSRQNKYCVKCGARLATSQQFYNPRPQGSSAQSDQQISNASSTTNKLWWVLFGIAIFVILGVAAYNNYEKEQRSEIRTCVYDDFNRDEVSVDIDQGDKKVLIVPTGDSAKELMRYIGVDDADSEEADEIDDMVYSSSKRIKKKVGEGWTVAMQNPDNPKRFFWIYKDGHLKYRIQDHVSDYDGDDYDSYGYNY